MGKTLDKKTREEEKLIEATKRTLNSANGMLVRGGVEIKGKMGQKIL